MPIKMLSVLAVVAAGCSHNVPAPVQIAQCALRAEPDRNRYVVAYKFYLTNGTDRAVTALRIGFNDWEHRLSIPPDGAVYDDYRALSPHASESVRLHTSPIPMTAADIAQGMHVRRARLGEWQPLACMAISAWFADGSVWVAKGRPGAAYALPTFRNWTESRKSSHSI